MARLNKKTSLIPTETLNYKGELKKSERDCVAWHVLSGCSQTDAFVLFLHPELVNSRAVVSRLTTEFFGSREVLEYMAEYEALVREIVNPPVKEVPEKPVYVQKPRLENESDKDYKERCKREAAESIVEKIIERVDDVEDIDGLLDTIKAMEKTGFFNEDMYVEKPPMRYLPVTCAECEYKKFIDEQVSSGNIEKI